MIITELLDQLAQQDIHLWAEGDKLKFRAPKGALTAEHRTLLKTHKAEILTILSEPKIYPVSFAQQRLWFLYQMEPDVAVYNIPLVFELEGQLDQDTLTRTLNEIVRRHETLRTIFAVIDDDPKQIIVPYRPFDLPMVDLLLWSEEERAAEQQRYIDIEVEQPFDLNHGPLVRFKLLRLTETRHVLLLTMHHIISDGWSVGVLYQELIAIYQAFAQDQPSSLPELPLQYADFARWQRDWFQGERAETQLVYWQKQLAGPLPILELPTDHPRPPMQTFQGKWHVVIMPQSLLEALKALSRQTNSTLFMTLLTAFKILLYRYTQQTDILVGMPIANRIRAEIEPLIGFFVNTLVLRSDLSNNPTFRELLQAVRQTALDAQAHQDLPFEKLVEVLQPERNMSHSALFQVMFSLQNTIQPPVELPGLTLQAQSIDDGSAKFDLFLALTETEAGLQARFQYNTDLFEAETIERMAGHYQMLLTGIIANSDTPINQLSLLTETEQQQLFAWNDTQVAYPDDQCVHHLFEAQAAATPAATAVLFPTTTDHNAQSLTYRELNEQANRLAHHLQSLNIGPGQRVGLCLERSLEMTVALLAILKAGAAYVPFDPNYPQERVSFMMADADLAVLLTQESLLDRLPALDAPAICLDQAELQLLYYPAENVTSNVGPEHPAYILYTSGSTGRPKGVVMGHRPLFNLISWQLDQPGFAEPTRTLQFTSLSFDVSFQEIFATWCAGGTLVLIPDTKRADSRALVRYINTHQIERLFLPFVALHHLALAANEQGLPPTSLQHVVTAGEQLQITPDIATMFKHLPACQLHNHYGPTESHVVMAFTLVGPAKQWPALPPIGRPIANTQIHLLDAHQHPVPVGIPGELYISGHCLAQGYLNHPDLTAQRFIDAPIAPDLISKSDADASSSSILNSKFYKTGDLARYRPDGNIEFLGRIDHQVKIRGFRVELGEIETVLTQHPTVEKCVVIAREDTPGNKRLVAYVVPKTMDNSLLTIDNYPLSIADLRHHLKIHLPDYLIPSAFVELEALPINPNGKVDRRALPAPDATHLDVATFVAPNGPVEEMLAEVWQAILGVERVSRQDNFFDLGGHSLLAMRVIARLQQVAQIELPLRDLFEQPTIAGLAPLIQAMSATTSQSWSNGHQVAAPTATPQPTTPAPLTPGQEGIWYLEQLRPDSAAYNMPRVWRIHGPLHISALEQSLNFIIQRHDSLRTSFRLIDDQPQPVIQPTLTISIDKIDLQHLPPTEREEQANQIVQAEAKRLFDLAQAPLLRAGVIQLEPTLFILTITTHHIISDGWSLGVLADDLSACYNAFVAGQAPTLPDLPMQYADFARWQHAQQQQDKFATHLAYWQQQLADAPPILELPTDYARPAMHTYTGDQVSLLLPPELAQAIQKLSQDNKATLFMTLLTAFKILLHRYTAQNNIVVGSPIFHRPKSELEPLIGFFLNNLVLHSDLSGEPTFQEILSKVRRTSLEAYTYQDIPYETIIKCFQADRDLSYNPLFQVAFNLFPSGDSSRLDLTNLSVETLSRTEIEAHSKFDMTLYTQHDGSHIQFYLVYRTDLFRPEHMAAMLAQYQHLLTQIVADPTQPINTYSLITPEQQTILPDPTCPLPDVWQGAVHDQFSRNAQQHPTQIAVVDEHEQWSYQELDQRSNQLAHYLLAHGLQPGDTVAIYGHRSASLIWAWLGILKAGAAFVNLDPAYPPERLRHHLDLAQPKALIHIAAAGPLPSAVTEATTKLLCHLTLPHRSQAALVDPLADWATTPPNVAVGPDHLAYIAFTSGSTGKPKGVQGRHGPLSHFLPWQVETFGMTPADRFSLLSGLAHDPLQRDIFTPLWVGATICIPEPDLIGSPGYLARWMHAQHITFAHLTPPMGQILTETAQADSHLATLRYAFFVGDKLTCHDISQLQAIAPNVTCINSYGSTETQRAVGYYLIPPGQSEPNHHLPKAVYPLGRGMPGCQLLLLNQHQQLAGLSEVGEIYIRSPHLAQGYVDDPHLTQERFIPNPFTQTPGDRLYKTGDLGRYLPDGNLEFLGRSDHQIKIRGFRVELGEIETVLNQHPTVESCVVIAREDQPGDKRLVAYVVAKTIDNCQLSITDLRDYLKTRLPDYMLPSAFVELENLPLTPNGKVDRRALPAPDPTHLDSSDSVAPRSPAEKILAEIWQDILNLEQISVHDNFFELGGHSLLAVQLLNRLRESHGVELSLRSIFERPTIAELAPTIEAIVTAEVEM